MRLLNWLLMGVACASCKTGNKLVGETPKGAEMAASAPLLVYKTSTDYRNLVPVLLSEDGKTIVSYPSPADIRTSKGFQKPTLLHQEYLIDNRGIGRKVAFLSYSYEAYSRLPEAPPILELYKALKDTNPLTELYNCGTRMASEKEEKMLNNWIDHGQLRTKCKVLK